MTQEEKKKKGKKFECIIGLICMVPSTIAILSFVLSFIIGLFDDFECAVLLEIGDDGIWHDNGLSIVIFCVGMAAIGVRLIKGNLRYIVKDKKKND